MSDAEPLRVPKEAAEPRPMGGTGYWLTDLWAAVIRQAVAHAAGEQMARRGSIRQAADHEWLFARSGRAAAQRRLVCTALGIDEDALQEHAQRRIGQSRTRR